MPPAWPVRSKNRNALESLGYQLPCWDFDDAVGRHEGAPSWIGHACWPRSLGRWTQERATSCYFLGTGTSIVSGASNATSDWAGSCVIIIKRPHENAVRWDQTRSIQLLRKAIGTLEDDIADRTEATASAKSHRLSSNSSFKIDDYRIESGRRRRASTKPARGTKKVGTHCELRRNAGMPAANCIAPPLWSVPAKAAKSALHTKAADAALTFCRAARGSSECGARPPKKDAHPRCRYPDRRQPNQERTVSLTPEQERAFLADLEKMGRAEVRPRLDRGTISSGRLTHCGGVVG
jgi:hypothetical protein